MNTVVDAGRVHVPVILLIAARGQGNEVTRSSWCCSWLVLVIVTIVFCVPGQMIILLGPATATRGYYRSPVVGELLYKCTMIVQHQYG